MVDPRLRLHRARVERGMDLNRICAVTALSPMVVRKIDEGRYEELPGGIYARAYIRSFAEAVGMRPDEAVTHVETLLPGAPDPLPALRESSHPSWFESVRDLAIERAAAFTLPRHPLGRAVAAFVDAMMLVAIGALLVVLAAWICGVTVPVLLDDAGLAVGAACAIHVVLYFAIFEGIARCTPGRALVSACSAARHVDAADQPTTSGVSDAPITNPRAS